MRPFDPFDPRAALVDLLQALLGFGVLLLLPFLLLGFSHDPDYGYYYSGDPGRHVNGFGWLLLALMTLATAAMAPSAWMLIRPSSWTVYRWRLEAGRDVAVALRLPPLAPSSGAGRILWHGFAAVASGGAHLGWHVLRAGAIAAKAERRYKQYCAQLTRIEVARAAARGSAIERLLELQASYHRQALRTRSRSLGRRQDLTAGALTRLGHNPSFTYPTSTITEPAGRRRVLTPALLGAAVLLTGGTGIGLLAQQPASSASAGPTTSTPTPATPTPFGLTPATTSPPPDEPAPAASAPATQPPLATAGTDATSSSAASRLPAGATVASPPPQPTCAVFDDVRLSYVRASRAQEVGVELFPRLTVRNNSRYPITVSPGGGAEATNPTLPDMPLQMDWPGYESPTVPAGATRTLEVGADTGSVLYVAPGATVTRFTVNATISSDTAGINDCAVRIARG